LFEIYLNAVRTTSTSSVRRNLFKLVFLPEIAVKVALSYINGDAKAL